MNTTVKQQLVDLFKKSLLSLDLLKELSGHIVCAETNNPQHGDYQVNLVMQLAKKIGKKPHDLANEIIQHLPKNDLIQNSTVAGPGFINIKLSDSYLVNFIKHIDQVNYLAKPETVVVDYSSPNLAKEMHVGHLRSTIIGDSLVRINEFIGNKVLRCNHVGDWGTQFGMLVAYILEQDLYKDGGLTIKDLESLYQQAKIRFDQDQEFANNARDYVVKLQSGDAQIKKIWQEFVSISLQHCQQLYDILKVKLTTDDVYGESYYNDLLPKMIDILKQKQLLQMSQGAACVFCNFDDKKQSQEEDENHSTEDVFIVQKQDGGFLYSTTDLATLYTRNISLYADKILYVVDARQALHFKMLFDVAKRAEIASDIMKLEHVKFGVMCNAQGQPFKTRDGGTVKLIDLIHEAHDRAKKMLLSKNVDASINIDELAQHLAISAIKYSDLSKNRTSDYIFDYDQMLSFEGNTAPYILYAYTRINSIFQKLPALAQGAADFVLDYNLLQHEVEREVMCHLTKFPDVVLQSAEQNMPHFICGYVYKLATLFMRFYEHCPVIVFDDDKQLTPLAKIRIALLKVVAKTIFNSLDLLGIETVNRM